MTAPFWRRRRLESASMNVPPPVMMMCQSGAAHFSTASRSSSRNFSSPTAA